jgi:hypothetical protein
MVNFRRRFVWRHRVFNALGVMILFAIFPCRAVESEGPRMDDSDDKTSMLEPAPDTGGITRPAAAVKISPPGNVFAALHATLQSSNGTLTPALRAAYLDWAQQTVLTDLAAAKCSVPADCLAEVLSDPTLRDAMFAAIYPPDPSILQNYAQLRAELGAGFMKKYRSLVVGVAVAKRVDGLLGASAPAQHPTKKALRKEKAAAVSAAENARLAEAIAEFMRKNPVSALDLYTTADKREQLASTLGGKGFTEGELKVVRDPGRLFEPLKLVMVRLGQRPAEREAFPSTVVWLRHLASVYEAKPSSTPPLKKGGVMSWPLFPMDRAPWPLLMPLSRSLPLGEADYIWEKFQGRHGDPRYHTYGPYKHPEGVQPLELQPSPWHWNAWPDRIVHGGVCTTMSGIAIDTHVSLCQPSVGAGQPGHSNLISFYAVGDLWNGMVEQAYAGGPDVTHAAWPFRDLEDTPVRLGLGAHKDAGAEYHLGLAQAMNVGLSQYMDTRILVNLFHTLPGADKSTLGNKLLVEATRINPFNPEPWYLLANQSTDATGGVGFVKHVIETAGGNHSQAEAEASPRNVSLENFVEIEHPKPVENQIYNYWRTVDEYVVRFAILSHPVPADEDQAKRIFTFLKTGVPGISAADLMPYRLRFEGDDSIKSGLENQVRQHLQAKGKNAKKGAKDFAAELNSFIQKTTPAEREPFLVTLRNLFPPDAADDLFLKAIHAAGAKARKK